jgi:hypothetical protein
VRTTGCSWQQCSCWSYSDNCVLLQLTLLQRTSAQRSRTFFLFLIGHRRHGSLKTHLLWWAIEDTFFDNRCLLLGVSLEMQVGKKRVFINSNQKTRGDMFFPCFLCELTHVFLAGFLHSAVYEWLDLATRRRHMNGSLLTFHRQDRLSERSLMLWGRYFAVRQKSGSRKIPFSRRSTEKLTAKSLFAISLFSALRENDFCRKLESKFEVVN